MTRSMTRSYTMTLPWQILWDSMLRHHSLIMNSEGSIIKKIEGPKPFPIFHSVIETLRRTWLITKVNVQT